MSHYYILVSNLKIEGANAASSNITVGFPAITAWMGMVHAWERKLWQMVPDIIPPVFEAVGISCRKFNLQTYKDKTSWIATIPNRRKPMEYRNSKYSHAAIIDEPKADMIVDLVLSLKDYEYQSYNDIVENLPDAIAQSRAVGGYVVSTPDILFMELEDDEDLKEMNRRFTTKMMPGFALINRPDLMEEDSSLDRMLDILSVQTSQITDENGNTYMTPPIQNTSGWIVPIVTGFRRLNEPTKPIKNERAARFKHCFVEPAISLGEFKMVNQIKNIKHMLWYYSHTDFKYHCYSEFCD